MSKKQSIVLAAAAAVGVLSAAPASAEGFLAGLARDAGLINEQQRQAVDGWHARQGRPLDHAANQAAGAAVDFFAPGYGRVVAQGLEMRDQMRRRAVGMGYAPAPAPMALPMPYPIY